MSILFEPFQINGLKLSNRFVRSATNDRWADPSGKVTDGLLRVYEALARGGVGLIVTGHAYVSPNGKAGPNMLGAYDDSLVSGLASLTDTVHKHHSKIVLQINHAGRQTASATIGGTPVAPSAVVNSLTKETPRALTNAEIESVIDAFAQAAARAVQAGFDAIQIHCAHGYLPSQFISPFTNRRDDAWGGSMAKRMRFPLRVYQRVRETVGDGFPVMIKLNSADYLDKGLSIEDSVRIAAAFSQAGIDAIEISGGTLESNDCMVKKNILEEDDEAYFLQHAKRFKTVADAPLILVGGLRSPRVMERILADGDADMVSLCRPLIREPDLVNQWKGGSRKRADCISCNGCQKFRDEPVRCIVLDPKKRRLKVQ
jgi:2,4-dienoyl-CoA reductase-like NADH-dependent reductase (Old Yellow Enzyme family)